MTQKTGISLGAFQRKYDDFRMLEIAKEIGAEYIDFALDYLTAANPDHIYAKSDAEIRAYYTRVREYADSLGVKISQTHGRFGNFTNIPEKDEIYIENSRIDCMATAILGAPVSVVHNVNVDPVEPEAVHFEVGFNRFACVMPFAKEYGVKIATETFGDDKKWGGPLCYFGDITPYKKFYELVKSTGDNAEYFTMCLDTGHTNMASRYPTQPSVADFVRACGSEITVLHIHDNNSLDDEHKIPRWGTIDWKDLIAALSEVGYTGVYSLENSFGHFGPDFEKETAEFSLKVLRNLIAHYDMR